METAFYDITNNSFQRFKTSKIKRLDVAGSTIGGFFYVAGGWLSSNTSSIKSVEVYNPQNDSWWETNPMNTPRKDHEMVGARGFIYAIGGHTGPHGVSGNFSRLDTTKTAERYNPLTDTWEFIEPTDYVYRRCGSTNIENKYILVSNVTHSSVYDIDKKSWNSWESYSYTDLLQSVGRDPNYSNFSFGNAIVYLDGKVFSIGLHIRFGGYGPPLGYIWTLDMKHYSGESKIIYNHNIIFLLSDIVIITVFVKRNRKRF
jgi:hypothetical protein